MKTDLDQNKKSLQYGKKTHVDSISLAEMVGVEPTRPCGPIAFRVRTSSAS